MSDLKRYFDEEMRYLREAGREFAQEYPDAGRLLAIDEVEDRDPYVERLFEGFAFLAARIRQTLDAEEDGIASHLLDLLVPGLDVPLPSVSIVEFRATSETASDLVLQARSEVLSTAIPTLGRPSRFALSRQLWMQPGELREAVFRFAEDGAASLELELRTIGAGSSFDLSRALEFYLHGDPGVVWTLQHWLLRRFAAIRISVDGGAFRAVDARFARGDEDGSWLPVGNGQSALLGMRDFLCADERFRFVRLEGLGSGRATSLRIQIGFRGVAPRFLERAVNASTLRLNVGPVVNAFTTTCEPIHLDHSLTEYPLRPQKGGGEEVLEVLKVKGISQADTSRMHPYSRFSSYRHVGRKGADAGYFEVHRRTNRSGAQRTSLSVGHPSPDYAFDDEYLGIDALVSDGGHPREHLQGQDLLRPGEGVPTHLKPIGLLRPSAVFRPPELSETRWLLLGHVQRSFRGLVEAKTLRDLLQSLLWDPREAKRSLIDRIHEVHLSSEHRMVDGVYWPFNVVVVRIVDETVSPDSWERIGLLDSFAARLGRIFLEEVPPGSRLSFRLLIDPVGIELEHSF